MLFVFGIMENDTSKGVRLQVLEEPQSGQYFSVGDILGVSFYSKGLNYFFEGICIGIRGKSFVTPETSFILRNIIGDVGVE